MGTPVQMFRAKDGKLFQTDIESNAHDSAVELCNRYSFFADGDKGIAYKILFVILVDFEISKRDSTT